MARPRKSNIPFILLVLLLLGAAWGLYRTFVAPVSETAGIFAITPLEYGEVTMTGYVGKDAPLGQPGNYYLVVEAGELDRHIFLATYDLDDLVGTKVTATGFLIPPEQEGELPTLTVDSMETN